LNDLEKTEPADKAYIEWWQTAPGRERWPKPKAKRKSIASQLRGFEAKEEYAEQSLA